MREQVTPIGDALRDNGYRVEREILHHDASSKVYAMKGDVNLTLPNSIILCNWTGRYPSPGRPLIFARVGVTRPE